MNIIFLDIDGVLNDEKWERICREESLTSDKVDETRIDPAKIGLINQLVVRTNAKIVISSSWRQTFGLLVCSQMLKRRGLIADIVDVTPTLINKCRGDEIQVWLQNNEALNVTNFVILDDSSEMNNVSQHLIKTDPRFGLTQEHVERALRMLMRHD